ncbi:MAG: hypothetical protein K0Q56_441 [Sporolactobacillus laevolacticus]|nr:hypothetical protein [Sporolactobacillus laevolacticus]
MIKTDKRFIYFTIPIVVLMTISSGIGVFHPNLYARETTDWLSQTIGQDLSNLFVVVPALILSSFFASRGSRAGMMIWIGVMITNIYSFVIYAFAVHFNFLFHVYCAILGLSIYSVLYFFKKYGNTDFKLWFTDKVAVKSVGMLLIVIAALFALLWLSDSLPAVLRNTVPENLVKDGLLTNPVHVLDFSFYLPLMVLSAIMLMKKQSLGYLLAPMMLVFAIMTAINIISLMAVSMMYLASNTWPMIGVFSILVLVCLGFLWRMLIRLR